MGGGSPQAPHEKSTLQAAQSLIQAGAGPTFAFGDSSGDIGMLGLAKVPVALNPNEDLAREAERRGWAAMPIAAAPEFLEGWLVA